MESPRFDTNTGERLEKFTPIQKLEPPTHDLGVEKPIVGVSNAESPRIDLEPVPAEKIEVKEKPEPVYLEDDARYKKFIEEASLEYLKYPRNDGLDYYGYLRREGYTWQDEKLFDKKGDEVKFPSTILGGGPYTDATKKARERFAKEYQEDSEKYTNKEKVRIYKSPSSDPAYESVEKEILASVNRNIADTHKRRGFVNSDQERELWNIERHLCNLRGWQEFVSLYPEKAAAYAANNEFIAAELEKIEKRKQAKSETNSQNVEDVPEYVEHPQPEQKNEQADMSRRESLIDKETDISSRSARTNDLPLKPELVNRGESPRTVPVEQASEKPEVVADMESSKEKENTSEEVLETPESKGKFVEMFKYKLGIDNITDAASIAYNGMISEWYKDKTDDGKRYITSMEQKKETIKGDVEHIESQLKIFRADGNISEKTLLKIEAEKQGLLTKLGETEVSIAEEKSYIEMLRINKEIFAKKRQESCLTYSERVKTELDPFEEKVSELKHTHSQLKGEIARDRAFLAQRQKEVTRITAAIDVEKFPSLRRANREILKKIESEVSAFETEITGREVAALEIEKSILKHEKRAESLREKLDNLKQIMKGESETRQPNEPVHASTAERNSHEHSYESASEQSKGAEFFDESELIESWNQLNGSEMLINPVVWKKSEGSKDKHPNKMTMDQFYGQTTLYSARYGKREQMVGMSELKKRPKKSGGLFRGLWRWLFGLPEPDISKKRMNENITMNRSKNKTKN